MSSFETTATVEEQGEVRVAGVPFAPGTEVEVIINAIVNAVDAKPADRVRRLFEALDKAQNVEPIGPFGRGEIYDREVLR